MKKVLLFNSNNNVALSITRGLGRVAIPVDGVAVNRGGVGMYSRYLGQKYRLPKIGSLSARMLQEILKNTGATYIMAMGEEALTQLNKLRSCIPDNVKLLFPKQNILDRAFDKSTTLSYAKKLGIDIPSSYFLADENQIRKLSKDIAYPVVLKFAESHLRNVPKHLTFKYRYAFCAEELIEFLKPYAETGVYPILQEYVPGKGVGIELCLYEGKVVGAFQHERIHEYPVSGGVSVFRKSVPLEKELLNTSVLLLSAMDWEGVAMVEFRRDPVSGRCVLMEINGRFWGSLPLALKAGVNFPLLLYRSMGEGVIDKPQDYKVGIKVQQLSTHFRWFSEAVFRRTSLPPEGFISRGKALCEFIAAFTPFVGHDIEQIGDPLPGLNFWAIKMGIRAPY